MVGAMFIFGLGVASIARREDPWFMLTDKYLKMRGLFNSKRFAYADMASVAVKYETVEIGFGSLDRDPLSIPHSCFASPDEEAAFVSDVNQRRALAGEAHPIDCAAPQGV